LEKKMKSSGKTQSKDEILNALETVQMLCGKGDIKGAYDLYISKAALENKGNSGFNVFRNFPALAEGQKCMTAFIGSDDLEKNVKEQIGLPAFGALINHMGLYEHQLGNLSAAKEWHLKSVEFEKAQGNMSGNITALHELSLVECAMGNIDESKKIIAEAMSLPHNNNEISLMNEYSYKAYYDFLSGDLDSALLNFGKSLFFENRDKDTKKESSYGLAGLQCAEFFLRTKSLEAFKKVNAFNLDFCRKKGWHLYRGMCQMMQGWYEISCNLLKDAEKSLQMAEPIIGTSGALEQICRLDIMRARLNGVEKKYEEGTDKINQTLPAIVDNGFRLLEADALILRANINLTRYKLDIVPNKSLLENVGKDGHAALKIASLSKYAWARVEALELLSLYYKIKYPPQQHPDINEEKYRHYEKEASEMRRKLVVSYQSVKKLKALEEQGV